MTIEKPDMETRQFTLPPYNVILHNDDVNVYEEVVAAVQKSVGISLDEAERVVRTAHTQGQAVVVTCSFEVAELHQERLASYQLTVTIEPA